MSHVTADNPPPLLASRRFLPLFVTQFLGATNDTLFKNAIGVLTVYRLLAADPAQAQLLVSAAAGIFILPFMFLSSVAGQLADRMDQARLARLVKGAELCIVTVGAAFLFLGDPYALLGVLFLLGVHSAFFGPIKYALLPQYLPTRELLAGNALVESGTFVAILIGTIAGALLVLAPGGLTITAAAIVGVAAAGLLASQWLPSAPAKQPALVLDWNLWRGARAVIRTVTAHREMRWAALGIAWFQGAGVAYLGQLPAFAKAILDADEQVLALMLTMFSIGVGLGAFACQRLLKGEISARYVPAAALGMAVFGVDLHLSGGSAARSGAMVGIGGFVATFSGLHVLLDLLLIAAFGGLFTVPLFAILQAASEVRERARVIAASNIINSTFIVVSTILVLVLLKLGVGVRGIFVAAALGNALIGLLAYRRLPGAAFSALVPWAIGRRL
jgi:acyl-[acyl-carrier-protein]-phospholipid O-acyltransferase/long-chain-fatty-acid--[acyl-carrier-protein] ligase